MKHTKGYKGPLCEGASPASNPISTRSMTKVLFPVFTAGVCALGLSACSSPDSRIKEHAATFSALPSETQGKIRGGHVDIGFTQEMVVMALGEPDRRYSRTTSEGTSEVWAYRDRSPRVSLGFGIAGGSHSSGVGAGVGLSSGDHAEDRVRIIFAQGRVTAIERRGGTN